MNAFALAHEPAFPRPNCQEGMTMRAYIATAALAGMLSREAVWPPAEMADMACEYADHLIAKLARQEGPKP